MNERHQYILRKIKSDKKVKVSRLARELFVSEMTIRRDLRQMEADGLLKRYHGGAIENDHDLLYPIKMRVWMNSNEKKELALKAKKHLKDYQTIFFNSSSTCAYLVPYLSEFEGIRVITNSIFIMQQVSNLHIPCTLTGGEYNRVENSLSGRATEDFLREVNVDIAILSCEGLSDDGYVTDSNAELAAVAKVALKNSKKKILLMDNSKLNSKYTYNICHVDILDELIII